MSLMMAWRICIIAPTIELTDAEWFGEFCQCFQSAQESAILYEEDDHMMRGQTRALR